MIAMAKRAVRTWAAAGLLTALALTPAVSSAHHSTSLFDPGKTMTLTGTVTEIFWGNPHIYIHVAVPVQADQAPEGQAENWSVISGTPSLNVRNGWKYQDVKVGDKVSAVVHPARDGRHEGILARITLADGRTIEGPREFLKKPQE